MNAHTLAEPKGKVVPYDALRTIDGDCWSLHHQAHILSILLESIEKDLDALKPHLRVNVASLTNLSHALHQGFEITGTANRLREAIDKLV